MGQGKTMNHLKNVNKLEKFLFYILGKRPDEFGLVPDHEGYVKLNELIRAMGEEKDYRYIRESHIREILLSSEKSLFEMSHEKIRAADRSGIETFENIIPKILYCGVKRKAYAHILEKGILPNHGDSHIILSSEQGMAERLGKRRSNDPLIITVPVTTAIKEGVDFNRKGETLYLSRHIPSSCISGPPAEKILGLQKAKEKQKSEPKKESFTPGSFTMKIGEEKTQKFAKEDWKNSKKRLRKEKKHSWPDE